MPIITRFAPSPTGFLHLGGARTALFNWLYARHYGGHFLLRIEDTDKERSDPRFTESIMEGLRWLDLLWDGDVIFQSARIKRHQEVAYTLLEKGLAYRCYTTPEELEIMRNNAYAAGIPAMYDRRWRDNNTPQNKPFVIRLKVPLTGETTFTDGVQNTVAVQNNTLDDMVILRSDGTPTYLLAVVVDDHDMGITNIIRGDDHLTNSFRQIQIYQAMGWHIPHMTHLPLIHGMDGAKLSKRHGAVDVMEYRTQGILPEALCNGLLRLGWSHQNEEKITREQAITWFDGSHLSPSCARFDIQKIFSLNSHYMRQKPVAEIRALLPSVYGDEAKIMAILPELIQRAKTLEEVAAQLPVYATLSMKPASLSEEQVQLLSRIYSALLDTAWDDELETHLRTWCTAENISFGSVAQCLRWSLTGQAVSPSVITVLHVLGKEWTCARIKDALGLYTM